MTDHLGTLPQMHYEHRAWLAFCRELKRGGIDINEATQIHAAIVLWGEYLAQLRLRQENEVVVAALAEAEDRYNREIGFLPH